MFAHEYKIYAALFEDINSGHVWASKSEIKTQRPVVCIRNPNEEKEIYCELLGIDKNYRNYYNCRNTYNLDNSILEGNHFSIVVNEWYRMKLGNISTQEEYLLEISEQNNVIGRFRACVDHPQIIVRIATWLGMIGSVLGIISMVLAFISLAYS